MTTWEAVCMAALLIGIAAAAGKWLDAKGGADK